MTDREKEFYANLKDERCKGCESSRSVTATGGYMFLGCYHKPYRGKMVTEIKDCPKKESNGWKSNMMNRFTKVE